MRAKGHGSRAFNNFIALASGLLLISKCLPLSYTTVLWAQLLSEKCELYLTYSASLQPPLYQALVDWKSINIPSGVLMETRNGNFLHRVYDYMPLGFDAEPVAMEMIPQTTVVQNVQLGLPSFSWSAPEPYMWIDYNGTQPPTSRLPNQQDEAINSLYNIRTSKLWEYGRAIVPGFVTAFPYNVTTGTRRYHAMRFNSTVECESVSEDQFPITCPGVKPYVTSIEAQNDTSSTELRVCVPGSWESHPWTLSRHRQDIKEEAFFQFSTSSGTRTLTTVRCSSATTRGYYELGNYRIDGAYGPLLEHWPSNEIIERDFNDISESCSPDDDDNSCQPHRYLPTEW